MDVRNSTVMSSGSTSNQTITTTTGPSITTIGEPGKTQVISVKNVSTDVCGVGLCSGSTFSSASDLMGQVLTIASIIGSQVDGGSNPSSTPKVLSADTAKSTPDNAPNDVPNDPSSSQGTTPTNLGLSSTTREVLITSTKSPQSGETATAEVVIITSTTVELISQSQSQVLSTPQSPGDLTSATGLDQGSNLTGPSFFDNKPALIGTFTVIGIVFLAFMGFLVIKLLKKRKILTTTEKARIYEVVDN
ncbi:hypothetical protein K435DRAFT_839865 [Dendrothele bispora CBS 962.96]|uniref:Uncharacterized protein n=1 Tax=Dendrothele bispora (strain CBS 962.96) TaxID=1314807 RepID=A0A4S8LY83_DENBC|nr:hypothetical protein K435DRAFT_839865 [Dendrothele bispora CBS 962.96]